MVLQDRVRLHKRLVPGETPVHLRGGGVAVQEGGAYDVLFGGGAGGVVTAGRNAEQAVVAGAEFMRCRAQATLIGKSVEGGVCFDDRHLGDVSLR